MNNIFSIDKKIKEYSDLIDKEKCKISNDNFNNNEINNEHNHFNDTEATTIKKISKIVRKIKILNYNTIKKFYLT